MKEKNICQKILNFLGFKHINIVDRIKKIISNQCSKNIKNTEDNSKLTNK
jgi:hypothetical protein